MERVTSRKLSVEEDIEDSLARSLLPPLFLVDYRHVYTGKCETESQRVLRKQYLEETDRFMTAWRAAEREYNRHVEVMVEKMGRKEEVVDEGAEKVKGMIEKLIEEAVAK